MSMFGGGATSSYTPGEAPNKAPMRDQNKIAKIAAQKRALIYRRTASTTTTLLTGSGAGRPTQSHASSLMAG